MPIWKKTVDQRGQKKSQAEQKNCLTCGVSLNDRQVIHLQCGITATPCKPHYMVLSIIYKLWLLLNVNVICSHIEYYSNIPFVLQKQGEQREKENN